MAKASDRFLKKYTQGTMRVIEIWVDRETGVQYLFQAYSYAGGLTPLLGADGRPLLCTAEELERLERGW